MRLACNSTSAPKNHTQTGLKAFGPLMPASLVADNVQVDIP